MLLSNNVLNLTLAAISLFSIVGQAKAGYVLTCANDRPGTGRSWNVTFNNSRDREQKMSRTITTTVGQEYRGGIKFEFIEASYGVTKSEQISTTCEVTVGPGESVTLSATIAGIFRNCVLKWEAAWYEPMHFIPPTTRETIFVPNGVLCDTK